MQEIREKIPSLQSQSGKAGSKPVRKKSENAPWWNDVCNEAVERRKTLLRIFKHDISLPNLRAYEEEAARCKKILKKQKILGLRNGCRDLNHQTPTDDQEISRLCPSTCVSQREDFFSDTRNKDNSVKDGGSDSLDRMGKDLNLKELELIINDLRKPNSAPGLNQITKT